MKKTIIVAAAVSSAALTGIVAVRAAKEVSTQVVEAEVYAEELFDDAVIGGPLPAPGALCRMAAVTNRTSGGAARWVAFDGEGWMALECAVAPRPKTAFKVRAEFDFSGEATQVRYSVREKDAAEFSVMSGEGGREWLPSPTPAKRKITKVEATHLGERA